MHDQPPLDATNITLNVDEDGIGGPTGCNYFGSNSAVIERSVIRCAEG